MAIDAEGKDWGELTINSLVDWVNDDDGLGSVNELSYYELETPWGTGAPVKGSEYSYGDGHAMGFIWLLADRYFSFSGVYSSWDSSDFDQYEEVFPVEVKAVAFENKAGKRLIDPVIVDVELV